MYVSTTITCHECKHVGMYVVAEWPPKLTLCNNCGQVFKLVQNSDPNCVSFGLVPFKFL